MGPVSSSENTAVSVEHLCDIPDTIKNHPQKFQTVSVAQKEDIFDFLFRLITWSEPSSVMGPVFRGVLVGKHISRRKKCP